MKRLSQLSWEEMLEIADEFLQFLFARSRGSVITITPSSLFLFFDIMKGLKLSYYGRSALYHAIEEIAPKYGWKMCIHRTKQTRKVRLYKSDLDLSLTSN